MRRLPYLISKPAILLLLAVAIHIGGRIAAFCSPYKVDSFIYTIAAYRFWQPDATAADLVPDKPVGQALLTGWVYRFWPGPPSRLAMLPIESGFMLAGYAIFFGLCVRLFGRRVAAALMLFFVIAHNSYNALDTTTDGFNLNENYPVLPMAAAVLAHLTMKHTAWRGLVRGLGIGLALAIKQSAVGLLAVMVIHGCTAAVVRRRYADGARAAFMTSIGMAACWGPLLWFLHARGWLISHFQELAEFSGERIGPMSWNIHEWYLLLPVLPLAWWCALGVVSWWGSSASRARDGCSDAPQHEECGHPSRSVPASRGSTIAFVWLWLATEVGIVWALNIPATHYYQQLVAPAALAGGFGMAALGRVVATLRMGERMTIWRWVGVTTAAVTVIAAMPLLAVTSRSIHRIDRQAEIREFAHWLEVWRSGPATEFFRELGHGVEW